MKRINIYITKEQDEELDHLSEISSTSRSDVIRLAIEDYRDKRSDQLERFSHDLANNIEESYMNKCESDIVYTIENNIKIVSLDEGYIPFILRDYQQRLLSKIDEFDELIVNKSRQCGWSKVVCAYIVHYMMFNEHKKIVIATGGNTTFAYDTMDTIRFMINELPPKFRRSFTTNNKKSIEFNNNKLMAFPIDSIDYTRIRINDMNLCFVDEFALCKRTNADRFLSHLSGIAEMNNNMNIPPCKLIISSTPNGTDHFCKLWTDAITNYNNLRPIEIPYYLVPGHNDEWASKLKQQLGATRFASEFECKFMGGKNYVI